MIGPGIGLGAGGGEQLGLDPLELRRAGGLLPNGSRDREDERRNSRDHGTCVRQDAHHGHRLRGGSNMAAQPPARLSRPYWRPTVTPRRCCIPANHPAIPFAPKGPTLATMPSAGVPALTSAAASAMTVGHSASPSMNMR